MSVEALLTIDFGSAFTKVAVRTGWNTGSSLVHGLPLAAREPGFCIPSVVARVRGANGERWAFGTEAANQLPGPNVTIYENWKPGLFGAAAAGGRFTSDELTDVATQFFRGLRSAMQEKTSDDDRPELPLRFCIPRLPERDASREFLSEILEASGWKLSPARPMVYEPESNVLGVLSRGRNVTWSPARQDFTYTPDRSPHLPRMLDPSLSRAFREGALQEKRGYYGVLVTDVGAFTTDFGYIRFDTSFFTDYSKPEITTASYDLGIRQLDDAVLECLSHEARGVIDRVSSAQWDTCKGQLYNGMPYQIPKREGGVVTLGQGKEASAIGDAVLAFAGRVCQARQEFCESKLTHAVHAGIPTGGGIMIPAVRQTLISRIKEEGTTTLHDLLDEDEPRGALSARASERDLERRRVENRDLVRGASAIGGCSVFFE